MSETPTKKEKTRQRMLDAAGRCFRSHGYAGIGVDGIAKSAGVTSGALYAHFGSKDAAFDAALAAGLDDVIEAIPKYRRDFGSGWVRTFAEYYLGRAHREDLAGGCAMAALSAEVVRARPEVHAAYEARMHRIAGLIADGLQGGDLDQRIARAWGMLAALIGGLVVARAVLDPDVAEMIAEAVRDSAVAAAGPAREGSP